LRLLDIARWPSILSPPQRDEQTHVQAHEEYQRARRSVHAAKSRMKAMHDGKGVADHLYVLHVYAAAGGTRARMGMHVPTADVT
jgi:hypothetical protein